MKYARIGPPIGPSPFPDSECTEVARCVAMDPSREVFNHVAGTGMLNDRTLVSQRGNLGWSTSGDLAGIQVRRTSNLRLIEHGDSLRENQISLQNGLFTQFDRQNEPTCEIGFGTETFPRPFKKQNLDEYSPFEFSVCPRWVMTSVIYTESGSQRGHHALT